MLKKSRILLIASLSAFVIILILLIVSAMSYRVIFTDLLSHYSKGRIFIVAGNTIICLKDSKSHLSRNRALADKDEKFRISIMSMTDFRYIEIFPEEEEDTEENADAPIVHYGTYKINASGHIGYLYLYYKDGSNYGTVRFPEWGRGAYEKLKFLKIYGDSIKFTRSATSLAEIRNLGADTYFTQNYSGKYTFGG